ncbi:serine dehydratase-like [Pyrgilauda ruficollis]|uniref:serine dehydratase-like n=1 Tax=Pyrgilauda ruficollis TaxID=221976 RepID=UPI001B862A26|nr:serine dehydratase-like [Pyrgilauda ruficollis]
MLLIALLSRPRVPKAAEWPCRGAVLCSGVVWEGSRDVLLAPKTSSMRSRAIPELSPACCLPAVLLRGVCSPVWGRTLKSCILLSLLCVWHWGRAGTVWGSQCSLFGLCWSQCSVPPLQDSLCPLLPGCSSLARATEEPPEAAGLRARAGPSSRSLLPPPPPCLLWSAPAPQSKGSAVGEDKQRHPADTSIRGQAMAAQPLGGQKPFHVVSPVLESLSLSKAVGTKVFMKLENVQPSGSFKIRGIGHLCQDAAKKGCRRFVCSSGGNAGLAAAYAARELALPITVVVPSSSGPTPVRKLQQLGATVEVYGKVWDDANSRAQELAKTEGWVIIPPFDHPLVWEGHASLVRELKDSLEDKPGAIVVAVGGGGLLAGVVAGLQQVGWQDVPIIAAETLGAHSFHEALKAGRLVTLPDITSVATCLGAKTVAARALECAQECQVLSQVVQDAEAVRAVQQFLDDERLLVEPACGAPLAVLYSGRLRRLQSEGRLPSPLRPVLLVVCGGSNIHTAQLRALQSQLGLE